MEFNCWAWHSMKLWRWVEISRMVKLSPNSCGIEAFMVSLHSGRIIFILSVGHVGALMKNCNLSYFNVFSPLFTFYKCRYIKTGVQIFIPAYDPHFFPLMLPNISSYWRSSNYLLCNVQRSGQFRHFKRLRDLIFFFFYDTGTFVLLFLQVF